MNELLQYYLIERVVNNEILMIYERDGCFCDEELKFSLEFFYINFITETYYNMEDAEEFFIFIFRSCCYELNL